MEELPTTTGAPVSTKKAFTLRHNILERIECEGICPRGRWQFLGKECALWLMWLATVVLASIAVAVSLFVVFYRTYALYEATHDSFFSFMLEVVPYLWLMVFAVAGALSLYHLRHTRRGYRYSLPYIVGGSVVLALLGGVGLHIIGMGFVFDRSLGQYVPSWYASQAMHEKEFWQQPEEGRLVAELRGEPLPALVAIVEDAEGKEWRVALGELFVKDIETLRTGKPVRLLGKQHEGEHETRFHACGVLPWMYDDYHTLADMRATREEAVARLREHRDRQRAEAKLTFDAATAGVRYLPAPKALCGDIMAVKRLSPRVGE